MKPYGEKRGSSRGIPRKEMIKPKRRLDGTVTDTPANEHGAFVIDVTPTEQDRIRRQPKKRARQDGKQLIKEEHDE